MIPHPEFENLYAVVTGASQGLGKAFAEELARRRINLILISLPGQELEDFASGLSSVYGIRTVAYETDLSIKVNVLRLAGMINNNYRIFMLINNAGLGGTKDFLTSGVDYVNSILQVNVVATALLTHQVLPNLARQSKSYVLNVSSMAAFSPIGYKTVYPASKAFIHSFSRGLYAELKNSGIFVSVVNPGPMKTNPEIRERIEKQGLIARLTLKDPEWVAERCIRQLFKRDTVIMVNPISWFLMKMVPIWIKLPLMTRTVKRELAS